jgi:hypothetical protein
LAQPVLVEPFDDATLFFQQNVSPYLWFEWKSVRQATEYHLEISTDPDFNDKVLSLKTPAIRYLVKKPLPQTALYWRVQALNEEKQSFWSRTQRVQIFSGRAPASKKASEKKR